MFHRPQHGRYIREAAEVDTSGVVWLPPAPFDPVPLATAGLLVLGGVVSWFTIPGSFEEAADPDSSAL
jgi:hypothetical protein